MKAKSQNRNHRAPTRDGLSALQFRLVAIEGNEFVAHEPVHALVESAPIERARGDPVVLIDDLRNGGVNGVLIIPPQFSQLQLEQAAPRLALIEDNTDNFVAATPIILRLKADEKAGGFTVARDHDLFLRRLAQIARQIIFQVSSIHDAFPAAKPMAVETCAPNVEQQTSVKMSKLFVSTP